MLPKIRLLRNFSPESITNHDWRYVGCLMNKLQVDCGVLLDDWYDFSYRDGIRHGEKWIGFLHAIQQPPKTHLFDLIPRLRSERPSGVRWKSLAELTLDPLFLNSLEQCVGLFTLSRTNTIFLQDRLSCPIESLPLIVPEPSSKFCYDEFIKDPKIIHVGQYMRNYQSFFNLKDYGYRKIFLMMKNFPFSDESCFYTKTSNTTFVDFLPFDKLDEIRNQSVSYLDFYGEFACVVLLQNIVRNIPTLTNRTKTNVEYLGENYPLFFDSHEEAECKLQNKELIYQAHKYLVDLTKITDDCFLSSFVNSNIYRSLPWISLI